MNIYVVIMYILIPLVVVLFIYAIKLKRDEKKRLAERMKKEAEAFNKKNNKNISGHSNTAIGYCSYFNNYSCSKNLYNLYFPDEQSSTHHE